MILFRKKIEFEGIGAFFWMCRYFKRNKLILYIKSVIDVKEKNEYEICTK